MNTVDLLPDAYFDLICLVIEELPTEMSPKIVTDCLRLLRPGGHLVVSWDFPFNQSLRRISQCVQVIRSCGFEIFFSNLEHLLFPRWPLREIQLEVMAWYQEADGRDTNCRIDWESAIFRARRPL